MTAASYLASPRATKEVLDRWGLSAKKSLGQNFLIEDGIIARILDLSQVEQGDLVLEIGPGIGTLTVALLQQGAYVSSIEKDPDLVAVLAETTARDSERFQLIQGDALKVGEQDIAAAFAALMSAAPSAPAAAPSAPAASASFAQLASVKLVANLPYAVAATVVLDYFQRLPFMESATVMVQAEVAARMQAQPGNKDYGAYTVKLGLYAQATGSFPVSRNCFLPAPHVDSTVIRLQRKSSQDLLAQAGNPQLDPQELAQETAFIADAAFAQRRKTIRNSMRSYYAAHGRDTQEADDLLTAANIDPGIRGETLSLQDFLTMGVMSLQNNKR